MADDTQMRFALNAHQMGWHIFPCEPGEKEPAYLYPGTSRPGRMTWPQVATNDINQIIEWWTERPECNIGVACKKSGLLVVDCDVPKVWSVDVVSDGRDNFEALCEYEGESWADTIDTYQVETPSFGVHLYYWWPPGVRGTQKKLAEYLDVRVGTERDGGYVVGAGSVTKAGWYNPSNPAPIKHAPLWLVHKVKARRPAVAESSPFTPAHSINLVGLHDTLRGAPEGNRNDTLNWAITKAARENPKMTQEALYTEFVEDALEAGLTLHEIRATVASAYRGVRYR